LTGCIFLKQGPYPAEQWASIPLVCGCSLQQGSQSARRGANKALDLMNRTGNSRLLVVQGDELEGILSLKDMLALLSLKMELNDMEKKT
jgi:hypothetical protein